VALLGVSFSVHAIAQTPSNNASQVDPFYGAFGTEVPIAVPSYHGLEPSLKLGYSSTAGNGFAGVGWALGGFSTIERASPGNGAPAYNANDIFVLDGQQLVPCATGSTSPSCTTCPVGSACYSTRIENYSRIAFDVLPNTWTVTQKDGTKVIYAAVYNVPSNTFRWGLSNVNDTRGNLVSYGWWCDSSSDCYPNTVSYNGTTVTFYREARPDPITFANGSYVGQTNYRLMTVDVQVSGSRARAYKLTYTTSGSTSRSLLASVQQFGKDATLDATGAVTGGTALPAMSLGYFSTSNDGSFGSLLGSAPTTSGADYNGDMRQGEPTFADVNGDGKADAVNFIASGTDSNFGTRVYVSLSKGDGTFGPLIGSAPTTSGAYYNGDGRHGYPMFADVNGDGRADAVLFEDASTTGNFGTRVYVSLSKGDGTFGPLIGSAPTTSGADYNGDMRQGEPTFADVNGDGKADAVNFIASGTDSNFGTRVYVSLSKGDGTFGPLIGSAPTTSGAYYNGDGRHGYPMFADVNGDGRADAVLFEDASTTGNFGTRVYVSLSRSDGTFGSLIGGAPTTSGADYNGDGRHGEPTFADVNGDGKADAVNFQDASTTGNFGTRVYVSLAAVGASSSLSTVSNGLGGTTTIGYTPSSAWANTYLPMGTVMQTVSSLTTTDGRGASSTTNYSYQGALWSSSERRFLGFRYVKGVVDAAGDYSETYYHQGVGDISKPDTTYLKDPAGNIFSYSSYSYAENTTAPYTSLLTQRWDYECNETSTCRRRLTQLGYDQYGNATQTTEYGDYDVTGDERTTYYGYQPNTSAYLVGLAAYDNVYSGIGSTGPLMKQTLFRYDGAPSYTTAPVQGLLTAQDRWNSQNGQNLTRTFAYDSHGNRTSETDELGHFVTHAFDATYHTFETQRCNALIQCVSFTWDTVLGQSTGQTDANGSSSTSHDVFGREQQRVTASGITTNYSYLSWGDPTQQRTRTSVADGTADGLWTDDYYDGIGRRWRTVHKDGGTKDSIFSDTSKRVWKESLTYAAGETVRYNVYAYDGAGRLATVTHPDGSQAHKSYGSGTGNAWEAQTDEMNNEHVYWKDGLGNTIQIREKNGTAYYYTTKTYDVLGNLIKVVDANGNVTTTTFDSLSRRLSACDPDLGCHTYGYDNASRMVSDKDARGNTITLAYDAANRMLSKSYADLTKVTWTYDEANHGASVGRATTVTSPNSTESLVYSAQGQVLSDTRCVQSTCETFKWGYDSVGRVSTTTYPDNEVVTMSYDGYGRLATVSNYVTSIGYDSSGAITSLVYPNGTTTTYAYDPNRRWLSSAQVVSGSSTAYQASYNYDAAARVTSTSSTTNPLMNVSYGYDGLNRLTSVSGNQTLSFAYDAIGNMTSNSAVGAYTYGDPKHVHAVTQAGSNAYSYDSNGNMLTGSGHTLTWDYENRVTSSKQGTVTTTFGYDADGQRSFKAGPKVITYYFGILADSVNGTLEKFYYAGPILVAKQSLGVKSWFHADHLGSIRLMTSSTGAKANTYDYAPFGATLSSSTTVANELGFGGQHRDAETGFIYMNARYYDASLGRFLSADSVVPSQQDPQALNRYAFAYNNPVSNTDPSGHDPVSAAITFIGATLTGATIAEAIAAIVISAVASELMGAIQSPLLQTVLSIAMGFEAGGPLGAVEAAVTSPLSPLDPNVKRAVGWAYAAYGMIQDVQQSSEIADHNAAEMERARAAKEADPSLSVEVMVDGSNPAGGIASHQGAANDLSNADNAWVVRLQNPNKFWLTGVFGEAGRSAFVDTLNEAITQLQPARIFGFSQGGAIINAAANADGIDKVFFNTSISAPIVDTGHITLYQNLSDIVWINPLTQGTSAYGDNITPYAASTSHDFNDGARLYMTGH